MTNQIHNGSGDNAVNKFETIVRSIHTRDLASVADSIMCDVRYRDTLRAREKLDVLNKIESLERDVKLLLNAFLIKVELTENLTLKSHAKQDLLTLVINPSIPNNVIDVVASILINLESRTQPELARERYRESNSNKPFINEIFFERLATQAEIEEKFNNSTRYNLLEQELTGLVRGALRVEQFKLAVDISTYLNKYFPSHNSEILLLFSESCLVLSQSDKHYWLFDKTVKEKIDCLVAKLSTLIISEDVRTVSILINLLSATSFSNYDLIELGRKYVDKIDDINSDCANTIRYMITASSSLITNFELTPAPLNLDGFIRLIDALDNSSIELPIVNNWLESGGRFNTGDDYINSFLMLNLKAILCIHGDKEKISSLSDDAQEFLDLDKNKFITLQPSALTKLCDIFTRLGQPLIAVNYLRLVIPSKPWGSPIFYCYLNALFDCEKYELIISQLKHLSAEDKSQFVFHIESQVYQRLSKYELSIESSKSAIELKPNDPHSWYLLLSSSRLNSASLDVLQSLVFDIPEDIFSTYHDSKIPLINEIAIFINAQIADRVLADWFVQDPGKVAKVLTQIHTNSLSNRTHVTSTSYTPVNCGPGVVYSDGFDTHRRILVRGVNINHACLLDINSPLGQFLDSMQKGETIHDSRFGEITLIERLPPNVAAFQHAIQLRNDSNDGTDVFKLFTMPTSKDEFFPYFEKIMQRFSPKDTGRDALKNPQIPLVMRGKYTNPDSPINGAVAHLTSKDTTQYLQLFGNGIERPSKVIIDLYTAVYLSLLGIASTLSKASVLTVISKQSKIIFDSWIENILRDDYLSFEYTDNGIIRYTAEDIKRNSFYFIQELKQLMSTSEVEALKPSDTPDNLIKIKSAIDDSVYSTFQLSVANEIPWLCVDHLMCILSYQSGYKVANINSILISLLNNSSFENRINGVKLSLFSGMPVPIMYRDMIELSASSTPTDVYLVARFIEKYSATFKSPEELLSFIVEATGRTIAAAAIDGEILRGGRCYNARYNGYTEYVFNFSCRAAINGLNGDTAEKKLALFLFNLSIRFNKVKELVDLLSWLASSFATGHFLDINEINRAFNDYQDNLLKV